MKFSSIVLLLLLVFDGLEGLTLPQERPDKGHNTSLLANFSGLYVRRNPCSKKEIESSSYEASHEFHHYDKGANWTDYTHKCSTLISNFLKSICNLMKFNNKHDGTFTFHVNTSISQNQADQHNCTDQKYSLPTIIIETTDYVNSEQNKKAKEKGLIGEGPKQEVGDGLSKKQKSPRNLEKAFGELSAISHEISTSSTLRQKAAVDRPVTEISEGPVETFETTQITEQTTNTNNMEQREEGGNAFVQIPQKYVAERPTVTPVNSREAITSQTDVTDHLTLGGTEKPNLGSENQFRSSKLEMKPTGSFEEVINREQFPVSQPKLSSDGVGMEASDFITPASLITQQRNNSLYGRASQLLQNENPSLILTTVSPTSTVEKQETVEEITEFSEQSESLNAGNIPPISPFETNINTNVQNVQPAESLDYLKKEAEFKMPQIVHRTTGSPEYLPTVVRFGQENVPAALPPPKKQPQTLKQSDILQYAPLTSKASSRTSTVDLGPQTHLDATTQPKPKNLFGQGFDYPVSGKINQESSYSQRETHLTSSEELTELNRDSQYHTTFPPKSIDPRYAGQVTGSPSAFPIDELSGQKASTIAFEFPGQKHLTSEINIKSGNVYGTQPGQNASYTPQVLNSYQKAAPLYPNESLIKSKQKTPSETTVQGPLPLVVAQYGEEVIDQFQSSEQSDSTYSQISQTTFDNNQNFPAPPVYGKKENIPPRVQLQPKAVLDEKNAQPLDYLTATSPPKPTNNGEGAIENFVSKPERQDAGQITNFSERTKSSKPSKIRPPVTEPTIDATPVTYSPQRNDVSSLEKEAVTAESSLRQASYVKSDVYPSQIPNYARPAPTQNNRFVSESSLTSDTVKYDLSNSFSTTSSTFLPSSTVSGPKNQKISLNPRNSYYDSPVEQPASNENNANSSSDELSEDSPTVSDSGSQMTTAVYESNSSKQNQQSVAPSTVIHESQTTSASPPVDLIIPVEIQSNEKNMLTSAPKSALPDYGTNNGRNFDSFTTNRPTILPLEPQSETELDNASPKPTKSSANQLPIVTRSQSRTTERFSETTSDSSDVYSQQTSSTLVPPSSSKEFATNTDYNFQEDSLSQSETAFASEQSYYLNQNNAETSPEQLEYDDIVSSQDAKTQIPQPQPSLHSDYSGQLSNNERESDIALTDLQTSKTFEGSEPSIQPILTYSPLSSVPSKTETFTTETYESDEVANEYPLSSQPERKPIASSALGRTETSSSSFGQSSLHQNIGTIDISQLPDSTPTYNSQFISVTPPPSSAVIEEPLFVKTILPARETYAVPETFGQDISTTPRPQSTNAVKYDQEIITIDSQPTSSPSPVPLLPVTYSGRFLNKTNERDFFGSSLAVAQQTEDRLERSDKKETTSQAVVKNSNRDLRNERIIQESNSNEDIKASSTTLIQAKYGPTPPINKGIENFPKAETNPNNFGLITSTIRPVHTKTTIDEEVITTTDNSNSLTLPSTQAPHADYSRKLSNEQFDGQRRYFPSATTPHPSRQFHPENRPAFHPPQGFLQHRQFDNRPYGNYPHPLNFNPQAPRPWPNQFDNYAREQQYNQFPTAFQHNRFEPHFPVSGGFQTGVNTQRDQFVFPGQSSNYGDRYFPHERPESLPPSSRVGPNFHSFQHPNVFQERDSQYRSYQAEGRLGEKDFNGQSSASQHVQNYEPYPYYSRNDFNQRFGPSYQSFGPESRDSFHPGQIPYDRINQMMAPSRNHPAGYFNPYGPPFLNNSNQEVEASYGQRNFDNREYSVKEAKIQAAQAVNLNQASPEVLADYKEALTGLASGEKLVEFDEEVITVSPEKGPSSEMTVDTEVREQRQEDNSQNHDRQNTNSLRKFNGTSASGQMLERSVPPQQTQQGNPQNGHVDFPLPGSSQTHPSPFSHPVDSLGPQRLPSPPNFSNQFRSASSDFQQQSNANFISARKPNVGNEVGSNPSQSHFYALGPEQIFPSRKPDPVSSRRSNVPGPYRNPVGRPIAASETFSSG